MIWVSLTLVVPLPEDSINPLLSLDIVYTAILLKFVYAVEAWVHQYADEVQPHTWRVASRKDWFTHWFVCPNANHRDQIIDLKVSKSA